MSPNSICSFVAYFAVKITTLQQHETLMGTWRDLPQRLRARWPEGTPCIQVATCLGKLWRPQPFSSAFNTQTVSPSVAGLP